jgi:hypothetical protein
VSFSAVTLCVASQRVFIVVYFVMTQSGYFWIHSRITKMKLAQVPFVKGIRSPALGTV